MRSECIATEKPGKMYPEVTSLKSTRPAGSGDLARNEIGHSIPDFSLNRQTAINNVQTRTKTKFITGCIARAAKSLEGQESVGLIPLHGFARWTRFIAIRFEQL
jgi:hypothetical protein